MVFPEHICGIVVSIFVIVMIKELLLRLLLSVTYKSCHYLSSSSSSCGILGVSSSGTGSDLIGVGVSVSRFRRAILRLAPPDREFTVPLICKSRQ